MRQLKFGVDALVADPTITGPARRLGLVTNDAARLAAPSPAGGGTRGVASRGTRDTESGDTRERGSMAGASPPPALATTRTALLEAGVPVVQLFSPEHGIGAAAADGAPVQDSIDPQTGLPVASLYGNRFAPPATLLRGLDGVLFDVPDAGARFYTYAWTLTHVIDACAEAGIPVWVLDRPNPGGGDLAAAEGPLLDPAHFSFLGRLDIPVRHALTLGELALLWQRERTPAADVRVVPCEGWDARAPWHRTGLEFVPMSPAIGSADAALLYPGLALFEATNVSVGRGTPLSFRAAGAPWLDARRVLRRLEHRSMPGIVARADAFTPATGPHAGSSCAAVRLDVVEPERVRPVAAGMALLADIAASHAHAFGWRVYPTAANPSGEGHLERLLGSGAACDALRSDPGAVTADVVAAWTAVPRWEDRCRKVLQYG